MLPNGALGPTGNAGVFVIWTPCAASAYIEVQRVVVDADTRQAIGAGNLDQFQPLGLGEPRHVDVEGVAEYVLGLLCAASLLVALGAAVSRHDIQFPPEVPLGLLPLGRQVLVDARHIHGQPEGAVACAN